MATDPDNPDTDGDGVDDGVDNCPLVENPDQANFSQVKDSVYDPRPAGDACDPDDDEDGVADEVERDWTPIRSTGIRTAISVPSA